MYVHILADHVTSCSFAVTSQTTSAPQPCPFAASTIVSCVSGLPGATSKPDSVSFEAYQKPRSFEEAVSVVQRVNSSF